MRHTQINLLIKLKNSSLLNIKEVVSSFSEKKLIFAKFLYKEGVLLSYAVRNNTLFLYPRYSNNYCPLTELKIFSKPSFDKHLKVKDISRLFNLNSIAAISTDAGLKNLTECKFEKKGGKILFIL